MNRSESNRINLIRFGHQFGSCLVSVLKNRLVSRTDSNRVRPSPIKLKDSNDIFFSNSPSSHRESHGSRALFSENFRSTWWSCENGTRFWGSRIPVLAEGNKFTIFLRDFFFFLNFFFSSSAPQRAAVWSTANGSLFSLDPKLHFRYNRYISFGCYFYEFCVHTSDLVSIIIEIRCWNALQIWAVPLLVNSNSIHVILNLS